MEEAEQRQGGSEWVQRTEEEEEKDKGGEEETEVDPEAAARPDGVPGHVGGGGNTRRTMYKERVKARESPAAWLKGYRNLGGGVRTLGVLRRRLERATVPLPLAVVSAVSSASGESSSSADTLLCCSQPLGFCSASVVERGSEVPN